MLPYSDSNSQSSLRLDVCKKQGSNIAFPSSLEEELHDKNLQCCHCNHHYALDYAEVEYPPFRTSDRGEITVLSCAEVLLISRDCAELARQLGDGLFEDGGLLRRRALFRGELGGAWFILDLFVALELVSVGLQTYWQL